MGSFVAAACRLDVLAAIMRPAQTLLRPKQSAASLPTDEARRIRTLEKQLTYERRISRALREVGLAIGSFDNLNEILELILDKVRDALEADRATLFFLTDKGDELVSRIAVGESVQSIRVHVGEGVAGSVAKTGKAVRIRDAYKDPRFLREWDDLTGYRTRSVLAAPMRNHQGRIIGVIQALNKKSKSNFTKEDLEILVALATHAAISVDNSRLYLSTLQKNAQLIETTQQLEHRVRDLKLLFELESSMARASSIEQLLRAALVEAVSVCRSHVGAVLLPDESTDASTAYVIRSGKLTDVRRVMMSPGEGFLGAVMVAGKPARTNDLHYDLKGARRTDKVMGIRMESAIGVPFGQESEGHSMGAIALYNKQQENDFSVDDMNFLRLIAANLSTAVQLYRSRRSQERAERLTSIGRLLSSVIHDLKTPMTVIGGYVQLMVDADEKKQRMLYGELVQKQFHVVHQMQQEVLEFARGEKSVLIRRVYLQNFFRYFEQSVRSMIEAKPIELVMEILDKGIAYFDESKLTRALQNLVHNAIEAMGKKGGKLIVRVERNDEGVIFMIADTGQGIPREIQGRLFEAFVTSGKKGGTGLGLAVVKKTMDEHNGRAEVETSKQGTTFRLILPQTKRTPPSES